MIDSLQEGVVSLIRDLNGNHVIQRCLQRLGPEDSQFVYDAACAHTMEIATHRHGCCVLQRCIDFATPVQKKLLVAEIAANALPLSQVCLLPERQPTLHEWTSFVHASCLECGLLVQFPALI